MIEFRTLGAVELTTDDGTPAVALLKDRKAVALLAYLVGETPRGYHTRDHLAALLWTERDEEGARNALRKCVHTVRHALRPAVIESRGDDELGVPADALWCDVAAFEQAFDGGRLARALELYRGDFLTGVFAKEAPEFQDWADRTRTRLRDRACAAAWSLAQNAEYDEQLTNATQWARRAAELAPTDERMLRRVITLLDRLGDRAGAMFVYDRFAKRLMRDLQVEPSLDTKALVRQVRERGA